MNREKLIELVKRPDWQGTPLWYQHALSILDAWLEEPEEPCIEVQRVMDIAAEALSDVDDGGDAIDTLGKLLACEVYPHGSDETKFRHLSTTTDVSPHSDEVVEALRDDLKKFRVPRQLIDGQPGGDATLVFWTDYKRKHEVLAAAVRELAWALVMSDATGSLNTAAKEKWLSARALARAIQEMKE